MIRILMLSILLMFTNFGLADGPAPGTTDPVVIPPLPEPPVPDAQADVGSCNAYGEELYNTCHRDAEIMIASETSVGGALAAGQESGVDQADGGAAVATQASRRRLQQQALCEAAAERCISHCDAAKQNHLNAQPTPEVTEANQTQEDGRRICGTILAIANDAGLSAAGLAQHAGGMNEAADAQRGGGMGGMMGPLLGAGAALGAMCLMGRGICEGDDDEGGDTGGPDGPADESEIDCNKAENHMYSKCEQHYINLCQANTNGDGCNEFNNLYCGMNLSVASTDDSAETNSTSLGDGQATAVNEEIPMVTENSGVGSTYCQYQVSVDYCKDDGTSSCPSCRQLEQSKSPVCQASPSTCLPGWTQAQLDEAKNYCPTDPMFMTAGGGTSDGSGNTTGDGTGAEDGSSTVAGGGSTNGGTTGGTTGGGTTGGLPPGSGGSNTGTGDGQPGTASLDQMGSTGNTTAGNYGTSGTFNPYADLTTYSVGSPFGPSLFANSSEVYAERCDAGLVDNCGPRDGLGVAPTSGKPGAGSAGTN